MNELSSTTESTYPMMTVPAQARALTLDEIKEVLQKLDSVTGMARRINETKIPEQPLIARAWMYPAELDSIDAQRRDFEHQHKRLLGYTNTNLRSKKLSPQVKQDMLQAVQPALALLDLYEVATGKLEAMSQTVPTMRNIKSCADTLAWANETVKRMRARDAGALAGFDMPQQDLDHLLRRFCAFKAQLDSSGIDIEKYSDVFAGYWQRTYEYRSAKGKLGTVKRAADILIEQGTYFWCMALWIENRLLGALGSTTVVMCEAPPQFPLLD